MARKDDELDESLLRKTKDKDQEKQTKEPVKVAVHKETYRARFSAIWAGDGQEEEIPLWLITFGDCIALMLTFFVMLYAMSTPSQEQWERMTSTMTMEFGEYFTKKWSAGFQDTISIDTLDTSTALKLSYIKALLDDMAEENERLADVLITQQADRLVISLPNDLLFETGQDEVESRGQRAIYVLGDLLSRIRNKIEVIGHADPRPVSGGKFQSNWHLSLARAASVSGVLKNAGYGRDITIRGLSDARYSELPEDMDEGKRLALSRRVDVVILKGDGSLRKRLKLDEL